MTKRSLILPLLLALATLACGLADDLLEPASTFPPPPTVSGNAGPVGTAPGSPPASSTATMEPGDLTGATPTAEASPAPSDGADPGAPPEALEGLASWISQAYGANLEATDACLRLRQAGWQRAEQACQKVDLNRDGFEEWLLGVTYTPTMDMEPGISGPPGDFWIVGDEGVLFQEKGTEEPDFSSGAPRLLDLPDLTGDGLPDVVTVFENCGAHTCFNNYQVISAHEGPVRNVVQLEGAQEIEGFPVVINLSYVDIEELEDVDGDDLPELVINGGIIGSVGAGLQRARTEVWGWNGEAVVLEEQVWEDTGYRFHRLYNANYAFDEEAYDVARDLYETVIVDVTLEETEWAGASAQLVRDYSRQFAGFRLALLPLMRGDITEATRWRNWLQESYPQAPMTSAAALLIDEWQSNGNDLARACARVTDFLEGSTDPTGPLLDMGYNNPSLTAAHVCPFG